MLCCALQTVDAVVHNETAAPSTSGSDRSDCVTETMVTVPAECVAATGTASDVQLSTSSAATIPGVIPSTSPTSECDTSGFHRSDHVIDTTVTLPAECVVSTGTVSNVQSAAAAYVIELPVVPAYSQLDYFITLADNQSTSAAPVVECVVDGMPTVQDSLGNVVLPEDIRPYPVGDRVHSTAVRRKSKSATLLTGSPFKAQLMDKGVSKRKSKSNSKLQPKGQKMNPKPKVKPSTRSRKVKNDGSNRNSVENDECGSCGYRYGEPNDPLIDDDWYVCINCAKWCHLSCGTTTKTAFTCYNCQ